MASYISQHNITYVRKEDPQVHEDAFNALITEIDPDIRHGKAFKLKNLLSQLNSFLGSSVGETETYTTQKLKRRLERHYGDSIVIHSQHGQGKSSIVMSSSVTLGDAVQAFAQLKEDFRDCQIETTSSDVPEQVNDNMSDLHRVVGLLRAEISSIESTTEYPIPDDICLGSTKISQPPLLTALFVWMLSKKAFDSADPEFKISDNKRRKTAALTETTINCARHDVIMPLSLGIAAQLHHAYGKRDIIDILSAHGFCICNDDLRRFLTAVANNEMKKIQDDVYIPHGLVPMDNGGQFLQEGDDNIDINCESVR